MIGKLYSSIPSRSDAGPVSFESRKGEVHLPQGTEMVTGPFTASRAELAPSMVLSRVRISPHSEFGIGGEFGIRNSEFGIRSSECGMGEDRGSRGRGCLAAGLAPRVAVPDAGATRNAEERLVHRFRRFAQIFGDTQSVKICEICGRNLWLRISSLQDAPYPSARFMWYNDEVGIGRGVWGESRHAAFGHRQPGARQ